MLRWIFAIALCLFPTSNGGAWVHGVLGCNSGTNYVLGSDCSDRLLTGNSDRLTAS